MSRIMSKRQLLLQSGNFNVHVQEPQYVNNVHRNMWKASLCIVKVGVENFDLRRIMGLLIDCAMCII